MKPRSRHRTRVFRFVGQHLALLILLAPAIGAPLPAGAAEAATAGTVARIQGTVDAKGSLGERALAKDAKVLVDDTVRTGPNGRVEIRMIDEAVLTLGANTVLKIDEYVFTGNEGSVLLDLVEGTFRAVSGLVKGGKTQAFLIKTPVATIGIRGTEFWGGPLDGVYQFALLAGTAIFVENAAGRVVISKPGFGTTVVAADQAPTTPNAWAAEKVARALDTVAF